MQCLKEKEKDILIEFIRERERKELNGSKADGSKNKK